MIFSVLDSRLFFTFSRRSSKSLSLSLLEISFKRPQQSKKALSWGCCVVMNSLCLSSALDLVVASRLQGLATFLRRKLRLCALNRSGTPSSSAVIWSCSACVSCQSSTSPSLVSAHSAGIVRREGFVCGWRIKMQDSRESSVV